MIILTLFRFLLSALLAALPAALVATAHAEPMSAGRSALLMSQLGRSLNRATKALSDAEYAPLADAAITAAVTDLDDGIRAAEDAVRTCAEDLFPAVVRTHSPERRAAYDLAYRDFMTAFAADLRSYRDEFVAQRGLEPTARTIAGLRERAYRLKLLTNQAHRELNQLARAP